MSVSAWHVSGDSKEELSEATFHLKLSVDLLYVAFTMFNCVPFIHDISKRRSVGFCRMLFQHLMR